MISRRDRRYNLEAADNLDLPDISRPRAVPEEVSKAVPEEASKEEKRPKKTREPKQPKKPGTGIFRAGLFILFSCIFATLLFIFVNTKYFDHIGIQSQASWFFIVYTSAFVVSLLFLYTLPGIKSFTCMFILSTAAIIYFFANFMFFDYIPSELNMALEKLSTTGFSVDPGSYTAFSQSLFFTLKTIPLNPAYVFKLLPLLGNILLACGISRIYKIWNDNKYICLAVVIAVMFLPQLILSSLVTFGFSLFAAFAVFAIYNLINARPNAAAAYIALSLAFSRFGVLLLPLMLIMMFVRQFKIRHVWGFIFIFALSFVPPYVMGGSLWDCILTYIGKTYSTQNLLTPNLYVFFGDAIQNYMFINLALCLAAVFVLSVVAYSFANRKVLDQKSVLPLMMVLSLGTALLLPAFSINIFLFVAALSIAYMSLNKRNLLPGAIILFCTFIPICLMLFGGEKALLMLCSAGLLVSCIWIARDLILYINDEKIKLEPILPDIKTEENL